MLSDGKTVSKIFLAISIGLMACESGDLNFQQSVRNQEDLVNLAIQSADVRLHNSGLSIVGKDAPGEIQPNFAGKDILIDIVGQFGNAFLKDDGIPEQMLFTLEKPIESLTWIGKEPQTRVLIDKSLILEPVDIQPTQMTFKFNTFKKPDFFLKGLHHLELHHKQYFTDKLIMIGSPVEGEEPTESLSPIINEVKILEDQNGLPINIELTGRNFMLYPKFSYSTMDGIFGFGHSTTIFEDGTSKSIVHIPDPEAFALMPENHTMVYSSPFGSYFTSYIYTSGQTQMVPVTQPDNLPVVDPDGLEPTVPVNEDAPTVPTSETDDSHHDHPLMLDQNTLGLAIASPISGSSFTVGSDITVFTVFSDPNQEIASVRLMSGFVTVAEDTSAPYVFNWDTDNLSSGTAPLKTLAKNALGDTILESEPIEIVLRNTATPGGNSSPTGTAPLAPNPTLTPTPTPTPTPPPVLAFGPQTFVRAAGPPNVFNVPLGLAAGTYTMEITNGDAGGNNRLSSGRVNIDGTDFAVPSDFGQSVALFTKTVTVGAGNMTVTLMSAPGNEIHIRFYQ